MRATEAPLAALARCETSEPATRGSNTTGTLRVVTLRGLSRSTARSPAVRPIFSGAFQIGGVAHARIIVVALHAGAFAGDRGHRDAVAGAEIGAAKAVAGHQHHAADAGRGGGAARLGDALDREPGRFGGARHGFELADRGQIGIDQVEIGKIVRQQRLRRRARRICLPAPRAPSPPRARPAPRCRRSPCRWWRPPPGGGRPARAGRDRRLRRASLSSTAPSRTSIDSDIERTATASAASAPARARP